MSSRPVCRGEAALADRLNVGEGPFRILEIISPGGFEHCLDEIAAAMASPDFDPQQMVAGAARYGLELQPDSIPALWSSKSVGEPEPALTAVTDE